MKSVFAYGALVASGGLLLLAVVASAQNAAEPQAQVSSSWRVPAANAAHGAELAQTCLTCHGTNGTPTDPPAPKLHRQRASYIYAALLEYRDGARRSELMEPFAKALSDQDARDVAAYLAGELLDVPPKARADLAIHERTNRDCTWCHGETGIGELEGMPVLTGQDPAYLRHALSAYREGSRGSPIMRSVVRDIPPGEDKALAEYYAAHDWLERNQ